MKPLISRIKRCDICAKYLVHGVRPVIRASHTSRILIIGQAPGRRVHETGIPWNDPSGDQLRDWLQIDNAQFYDESKIAIMPMGFCYPGTGKSGDLAPRKECAPQWHDLLLNKMPEVKLTLLIGQYAQKHYLMDAYKSVTESVRNFEMHQPNFFPLPHPSPRNRIWQKKNPWFVTDVLPQLRHKVSSILKS